MDMRKAYLEQRVRGISKRHLPKVRMSLTLNM